MTQPVFVDETTPTARALLVLEMVQNSPGIRGEQLADRLGMTDRAVRRYVGNLRGAGIPVESTRGKYGGYRIGRGVRLAPLMFTAPEALGLVMAVLEGRAHDPTDPVGQAVAKIIRVLPQAGRGAGGGRRPDERADARRPLHAARPQDHGRTGDRLRVAAPAAALLPARPREDPRDGRRPVGGRGAVREVVPARLVAHRRRAADPADGPGGRGRGPARVVRGPGRPRPGRRDRGAPLRGLDPQDRGGRGRPDRRREVLGAAQAGPPRGDRRAHDPAGRQHRRARLVRRAAGRASRGPSGW